MLGAIGHDMRTPLASLRIRAESVEPAEERQRMIATIEEMTAMLDDTLALARSGPGERAGARRRPHRARRHRGRGIPRARPRRRDGGERAARRRRSGPICSAARFATWSTTASNMAAPPGSRCAPAGDRVAIEIADRGPGIPEAELGNVQEPFVRLESLAQPRDRRLRPRPHPRAQRRSGAWRQRSSWRTGPDGGLLARILLRSPSQRRRSFRGGAAGSSAGAKLFTLRLPHHSSSAWAPA